MLLKFTCMNRGRKQCKYVIDITSVEYRFEIIRTISKPFTFKTTHKNVSYDWTQWRSYSYTIYLFIIFAVKYKERFFGGYVKQIMKVMLWDVRGNLVVIV